MVVLCAENEDSGEELNGEGVYAIGGGGKHGG